MQMSSSVKAALALVVAITAYFLVRGVFGGGGETETAAPVESTLFTVVAADIAPREWRDVVTLRGRTEAARKVTVRAETPGAVAETPLAQGSQVTAGDVLCRLKVDARQAGLAEARAAKRQAQLDYNAAAALAEEGFRSETSLAGFKAALDRARAAEEQAALGLERTKIVAPFDGVFDQRAVEVGDYMRVGDACGVVIQRTPFLVTGAVSEKDVAKIAKGDRGVARLVTGETIEGAVRFVAAAADPATRTFNVELEVPNEDGTLRDGVTAEFDVFASPRDAYFLPHSALTLNDNGEIGVRTVNADDTVVFSRISLVGEEPEGVWAAGLDGAMKLIVRGQNFVREGQKVRVAPPSDVANPVTGAVSAPTRQSESAL
ncbi:MAG: efflux RND transporter periplasmic adaptor subunit [Pseudomonadota bacterium]